MSWLLQIVYISFIHNCQNSEATEMSFSRRIDKQWFKPTKEYYPTLQRSELSSQEKIWRKWKWLLLSERGMSEKAAQWAISMIGYFRKGKTVETVKTAVVASGWGKEDGEAGPR